MDKNMEATICVKGLLQRSIPPFPAKGLPKKTTRLKVKV